MNLEHLAAEVIGGDSVGEDAVVEQGWLMDQQIVDFHDVQTHFGIEQVIEQEFLVLG